MQVYVTYKMFVKSVPISQCDKQENIGIHSGVWANLWTLYLAHDSVDRSF